MSEEIFNKVVADLKKGQPKRGDTIDLPSFFIHIKNFILLYLIEILLKVSANQMFVIDKIDRCLHPAMTTRMIELFLKMAEQQNTQLIITNHESRLLTIEILRNDEVCFVIKNEKGESILNPLEKYQLRADKKVYSAMFYGILSDVLPNYNEKKIEFIIEKETSINVYSN